MIEHESYREIKGWGVLRDGDGWIVRDGDDVHFRGKTLASAKAWIVDREAADLEARRAANLEADAASWAAAIQNRPLVPTSGAWAVQDFTPDLWVVSVYVDGVKVRQETVERHWDGGPAGPTPNELVKSWGFEGPTGWTGNRARSMAFVGEGAQA